jgi:uncharacterized glyoxalase superfamily protein PhnB
MNTRTAPKPATATAALRLDGITLASRDLGRSSRFYAEGLGLAPAVETDAFRMFHLGGLTSALGLYDRKALAEDVGAHPEADGFQPVTLNYIVESADDVDALIRQAEAAGGRIAKPAKRALWGYSGYLADPDGHLWKIAASKAPPLLGRRPPARRHDRLEAARVLKEATVLLGAEDVSRTKRFYGEGLGASVHKDYGKFVSFEGQEGLAGLALYRREALADDAGVPPSGRGFRGVVLSAEVSNPEAVERAVARAAQAGAVVRRPPQAAKWGGFFGCFSDPDGQVWKVAAKG